MEGAAGSQETGTCALFGGAPIYILYTGKKSESIEYSNSSTMLRIALTAAGVAATTALPTHEQPLEEIARWCGGARVK